VYAGPFLSPDHAAFVGEVLIQIKYRINASTITQVPMDQFTHYHSKLPQHDVLLAQGLPAESFLDMQDRSDYATASGPIKLHTDFPARMREAFRRAPLTSRAWNLTRRVHRTHPRRKYSGGYLSQLW
jgi:hypothetical protein